MPVETRASLHAALEALDGVRRAVLDDDPLRVWLVCDSADAPTELRARALLAQHGHPAAAVPVEIAYLPPAEPRRRVRFLSVRTGPARTGGAGARVELEWGGEVRTGEAHGESGAAMELRLVALATLHALEEVLEARTRFTLVGIKPMRAFEADVVVVLVRAEGVPPLVGAALAADDAPRAVALAVLNATNRLLGNYLSVPG